jgi:hypothetical protein
MYVYKKYLIGKSNCNMVLGFYIEHSISRRENAIKSCASAEEEHPPIMATPTTAGDKATWGSVQVIDVALRLEVILRRREINSSTPCSRVARPSSWSRIVLAENHRRLETTAAHIDSVNSVYRPQNPADKKLHPSSP